MKHKITKFFLLLATLIYLSGLPQFAWALPTLSWDWNDGTLQGWTPVPPFGGALGVDASFGNPGGSMFATDTVFQGGGLIAQAPSTLAGNLSLYQGIAWDEFIPGQGSLTNQSTHVVIAGTDGTVYESDKTLGPIDAWHAKFVSFSDPSVWTLYSGTTSFSNVILSVAALGIQMETSNQGNGNVESWIDNVVANPVSNPVPEPATLVLLCSGLLAFASLKRRALRLGCGYR